MSWNSMGNHERDHDKAVEREAAASMADPCKPLEEEIETLEEQVQYVDATKSVRDPLYSQFVQAMTAKFPRPSSQTPLTPDELKRKAETASEIIEGLLKEESSQKKIMKSRSAK